MQAIPSSQGMEMEQQISFNLQQETTDSLQPQFVVAKPKPRRWTPMRGFLPVVDRVAQDNAKDLRSRGLPLEVLPEFRAVRGSLPEHNSWALPASASQRMSMPQQAVDQSCWGPTAGVGDVSPTQFSDCRQRGPLCLNSNKPPSYAPGCSPLVETPLRLNPPAAAAPARAPTQYIQSGGRFYPQHQQGPCTSPFPSLPRQAGPPMLESVQAQDHIWVHHRAMHARNSLSANQGGTPYQLGPSSRFSGEESLQQAQRGRQSSMPAFPSVLLTQQLALVQLKARLDAHLAASHSSLSTPIAEIQLELENFQQAQQAIWEQICAQQRSTPELSARPCLNLSPVAQHRLGVDQSWTYPPGGCKQLQISPMAVLQSEPPGGVGTHSQQATQAFPSSPARMDQSPTGGHSSLGFAQTIPTMPPLPSQGQGFISCQNAAVCQEELKPRMQTSAGQSALEKKLQDNRTRSGDSRTSISSTALLRAMNSMPLSAPPETPRPGSKSDRILYTPQGPTACVGERPVLGQPALEPPGNVPSPAISNGSPMGGEAAAPSLPDQEQTAQPCQEEDNAQPELHREGSSGGAARSSPSAKYHQEVDHSAMEEDQIRNREHSRESAKEVTGLASPAHHTPSESAWDNVLDVAEILESSYKGIQTDEADILAAWARVAEVLKKSALHSGLHSSREATRSTPDDSSAIFRKDNPAHSVDRLDGEEGDDDSAMVEDEFWSRSPNRRRSIMPYPQNSPEPSETPELLQGALLLSGQPSLDPADSAKDTTETSSQPPIAPAWFFSVGAPNLQVPADSEAYLPAPASVEIVPLGQPQADAVSEAVVAQPLLKSSRRRPLTRAREAGASWNQPCANNRVLPVNPISKPVRGQGLPNSEATKGVQQRVCGVPAGIGTPVGKRRRQPNPLFEEASLRRSSRAKRAVVLEEDWVGSLGSDDESLKPASLNPDLLEDVEPAAVVDKVPAKPRGKKPRLQLMKAGRDTVPAPKPQVGKKKPARRALAPKSLSLVAKCKRNLKRLKEASTVVGRDVGKEKLSQTSAVVTRRRAQAACKAAVQTRSALAVKGEATKRSGLLSKVLSSVVKASAAAMKAIKPGKKEAKLEALKAVSRRLNLKSAGGKPQECSMPKGPGRRRNTSKKVIAVKLSGDPEETIDALTLTATTINREVSGSAGPELAQEMRSSVLPCSERYPKRLPGDHHMQAASFKTFIARVRGNSDHFQSDGRILRCKQYMKPDANCEMIDEVISALAVNTRVEVLYIQNYERGMRDEQLRRLTNEVLKHRRIWALNIGENFNISLDAWQEFTDALVDTSVSFLYVSEHHLLRTDLKVQMKDAIRKNRRKLELKDAAMNGLIKNMWFNPTAEVNRRREVALRKQTADVAVQ